MFVLGFYYTCCYNCNLSSAARSRSVPPSNYGWGGGSHPEIVDYRMAACGWFPQLCCSAFILLLILGTVYDYCNVFLHNL